MNGIGRLLRMRRKLWFSYYSFARGPSLIGLVVGVSRIVLPLRILFLLLGLIRGCFVWLFLLPLFTTVNSLCFYCFSFINNILFLLIQKKKCQCRLCLGAWADHGERTGGFYACNRYEVAKQEGVVS